MAWLKKNSRLIIASHNEGKVKEIAQHLEPYYINVVAAKNFTPPISEIEETGKTFAENAALKAQAAARESALYALSDDSGLEVDALNKRPGIYSARYAERQTQKGKIRDFNWACHKLWGELGRELERELESIKKEEKPKHFYASFICVLALAAPNGEIKLFEGKVDGELVYPPRGQNGFGYDPIFLPLGYSETFGEMPPEKKHALSHRARAFDKFIQEEFSPK